MSNPTLPEVQVERINCYQYRVRCPYCNHFHYHGRGGADQELLGVRSSDCFLFGDVDGGNYTLIDKEAPKAGRIRQSGHRKLIRTAHVTMVDV